MADIHDGTGVITKTSSNSCEVSLTILGSLKSISFNKSVFYTFGVQCEGNMMNILEDGMEVELCYRIFSPEGKPCVVAVWLGEKPDNLKRDKSSLKAMYDSSGHVVSFVGDDFLVQDKDSNIVYIKKRVVFQEGSPLKDDMAINQEIFFDVIPFKYDHPSGASYQATCAWIGPKPRLVDRFDLCSSILDSGLSRREIVEGTVAVIPNHVLALVDVALKSVSIKVFVFRSSFKDPCARIGDVIDVGDVLSMRLAYELMFSGRKLWYASQAAKSRDDICFYQEVSPELLAEIDDKPHCNPTDEQLMKFSKDAVVLCNIPPLSGAISLNPNDDGACITYGDLKVFVNRDNFYIAGNRCSDAEFMYYVVPGTNIAFFEAILRPESDVTDFTHEATCAWVGRNQKPTVHVLAASLCKPNRHLLEKGIDFVGSVVKYLSPFMAFVLIPDEKTFVLIDVSNFVTQPQYPPADKAVGIFITNHVKLNDTVQFNLEKNPRFPELFLTYNIRSLSSVGTSGKINPDLNEKINPVLNEKIKPDLNEKIKPDLNEKIKPDLSACQKSLPSQKRTRKKGRKLLL